MADYFSTHKRHCTFEMAGMYGGGGMRVGVEIRSFTYAIGGTL